MPLCKGKMREEEDSDSDESFHCCGKPEDLLEDFRSSMETSKPEVNEVRVPDNQDYYLYSAGLERANPPSNGPTLSSICDSQRAPTVCSSDSGHTRVGSALLIIKTDEVVFPFSSTEMRTIRIQPVKPSQPLKPMKKSKWKIQIPRPQSSLRAVISPTNDHPPSPEVSTTQASALHGPPPPRSCGRRRGMVFTSTSLPEQLKELAETEGSDGSGT
ncbi:hypothetical protein PTTG_07030 [Puccinia triticina 1-1 BBBD Race 1]|uniref:Uncharacterized protein n=1 Tax=Puccinia triticina (isolate 1-1 / race 1 (BBBD)) TaxID=630390 RepID=A0A0C4F1Q9_PUCT1|nr:hypothetical protein PTTG_07030 [Puccinia triticina 1-1 BBBD Race 1]